ncbi:ATP-binding protein [Flavobacterium sp. SUN046]|uniref:ATP-binding protein n=1 Tax=Flavobacterium sp. SUN046 TaxID=3002440 RepID=UPI002DBCFBE2|nr:ATP-binding protein [Flavobacterium sp. SUN046]MEC4050113.1 ATP-binding protein [Flavobacterium sp. SUN046]
MKKHTTKITSKSIEGSGLPSDYKKAIAEYLWNGFDAGASTINIDFSANSIGTLESFSISDDGSGISFDNISDTFGNFMVSLKANSFSETGFVKGKKGKGRYSFSIFCNKATWRTIFKTKEDKFLEYNIQIKKENSQDFETFDRVISKEQKTGTKVIFEDFTQIYGDLLDNEEFEKFLANEFGWFLYLNKERDFKMFLNNISLDYFSVIDDADEKDIPIGDYNFKVSYIRWKEKIGDKYYYYFLNDEKKQVFRKHTSFNNKAVDFHHSLYIESTYFDNFNATKEDNPTFDFSDKNQTDVTFRSLLELLNEFVSEKEKLFIRNLKANELIESYNKNKVFPVFKNNSYDHLRKIDLENVIKELYSVQPKIFQSLTITQSKTIVGFLNLLLDTEQRESVLTIVENVVKLTDDEREELAKTLKRTNLSHINALIKLLENRFNVVEILKTLIFDLEKFTNEREHIQKVIEGNYWLFGEQFHLISADKNFEILLNNYFAHLEIDNKKPETIDSKEKLKRPDIFISRKSDIPDATNNDLTIEENIIVELKRPSIVIGSEQFQQVERYLRFIIEEERFNSLRRNWKFILVGKKVDDYIVDLYENQKNKGQKYLVQSIRNYEIYAMTWDDLFMLFKIKHKHLIDKLEFKSDVIKKLEERGVNLDKDASDELTKIATNGQLN